MSQQDTKTDNASTALGDAESSQEQTVSPLEALEVKAEEAYKAYKATGDMPNDLSPELELIVRDRKRQRDSQASYTEANQKLKATQAENEALKALALEGKTINLTEDQEQELEELKFSNVEAWRTKMNAYESAALTQRTELITEKTTASSKKAIEAERLEHLKEFTAETGLELTDDIIANDIPPRILNELKEGTVSFKEFLEKAGKYLSADKVIAKSGVDADLAKGLDFDSVAGTATADNTASQTDFAHQYASGNIDM